MSKHTSGPWNAEGATVVDSDGNHVASAVNIPHDFLALHPEVEANARLIAAAPELLEACISAEKAYRRAAGEYPNDEIKSLKLMRVAIAKATGR